MAMVYDPVLCMMVEKSNKVQDATVNVNHIAEYLWTWEDGSAAKDIYNQVFSRVSANAKTREEAEAKAAKEYKKEIDSIYSVLQSTVGVILKRGYQKAKELI